MADAYILRAIGRRSTLYNCVRREKMPTIKYRKQPAIRTRLFLSRGTGNGCFSTPAFWYRYVPILFSRVMSLAFAYFCPKSGRLVCIDDGIHVAHPPTTTTYSDSYQKTCSRHYKQPPHSETNKSTVWTGPWKSDTRDTH